MAKFSRRKTLAVIEGKKHVQELQIELEYLLYVTVI